MHAFAKQGKSSQQAGSSRPAVPAHSRLGTGHDAMARLQGTIGNQAVRRTLQLSAAEQATAATAPLTQSDGLRISQPGDRSEVEADRVADAVMRMAAGQATPATTSPDGLTPIERASSAGNAEAGTIHREATAAAPSISPEGLSATPSTVGNGGQMLDAGTRAFFEPKLGFDLSAVRVHTDAEAEQSARAVGAKAYTFGHNIVFRRGAYRPASGAGKRLLAHELAHVVQTASSSSARGDTIYRQPDASAQQLAAIDYEIQQLAMIPAIGPMAGLKMMRLAELYQMRASLVGSGGSGGDQSERHQQERTAEAKSTPASPAAKNESSGGDMSLLSEMRQVDIDQMQSSFMFGSQVDQPAASPAPVETGCHADPYARRAGSTACGQKRPDQATRATMNAMAKPPADFSAFEKRERAELDRLNAAYFQWQQTGKFPQSREFSPYEIEKDRIIPVEQRWDIYEKPDPNNLETADFNERFFRSEEEYAAEHQRRYAVYLAAVKACGQSRPSHFVCRDKVMKTYYPGRFGLYDAAATWANADLEVAMPVLREGGPVAGFVFHATHEWLGWSSDRAADAAGLASGLTNLAGAKLQQVAANRNAGQSVAPRDEMTPPPEHVAPAPDLEPVTTTASNAKAVRAADPLAGAVPPGSKSDVSSAEPPTVVRPDGPMRRPPGGGRRAGMTATEKTLTPHTESTPVIEVLPRSTVPMRDFEPAEPGHYIYRKPPSDATQAQILARAGRTTDGRLRDTNTGRALNEGEAVWGHGPDFQFKDMRDMAEKRGWTQQQFDQFFEDPAMWQIEYGPTNSSRVFDRIPRQRPVH